MAIDLSPDKIGAGSNFEVMRKALFEVVIPGLGTDDLRIACTGFPFPKFAVSAVDYNYKNTTIKLAGRSKLTQDMTLKLRDVVDGKVRNALWAWAITVYNPTTGAIGLQSAYKKQCSLVMTGPDGNTPQEWVLKGVWPSAIDFGEGDNSADGPVEINATLSVDYVLKS